MSKVTFADLNYTGPLYTEKQIAELTGVSIKTLQNNRSLNRGLPFIRVGANGSAIRYSDPRLICEVYALPKKGG